MLDVSHCCMNMEDEDEYVDFYDFNKTWENHPLLIKDDGSNAIMEAKENDEEEKPKKKTKKTTDSDDEWDDCELEEEDIKSAKDEEETEEKSDSFQIVDASDKTDAEKTDTTQSFEIVDPDTSEAASSILKKKDGVTGKTRAEVFANLNIKKAKILHTGEVQLGNGKVMGIRKFNYIYKQKPRAPDDRESVLVNKLAVEYRKIRAIANGGYKDSLFEQEQKAFICRRIFEDKKQRRELKQGWGNNLLQHHFKDPTGHLQ